MPTYYARKTGNINATDVWATTPSGTASDLFPTFTSADTLVANSFTITINVNTSVAEIRNDAFSGATVGGNFSISSGNITLSANMVNLSSTLLFVTNLNSTLVNIVATTISSASSFGSNHYCISSTQQGSLNVTATNIIGSAAGSGVRQAAIYVNTSGTTTINCPTITGGNNASRNAIFSESGIIINGNVIGGSGGAGLHYSATGIATVTTATGGVGSVGVSNTSTGTIRITRAIGNAYGPGNTAGLLAAVGVANVGLGVIEIEQLEYGLYGMSPTSGTGIRLKKANTNVAVFNYADSAGAKTLIDATANAAMPAATDVRSGVSYASGAATGSCAVPAAGSVALGVPVDATTGTAVLTLANVQSALTAQGLTSARAGALDNLDTTVSSRLAPSGTLATVTTLTNAPASVTPSDIWSHASRTITGGTVDTLTNAPSVPSASAIASQVRSELSVELSRIDAATSTRATPANIPTADITAIKGKTDLLNTTRLAQVSTTEIVGNLLAQANS